MNWQVNGLKQERKWDIIMNQTVGSFGYECMIYILFLFYANITSMRINKKTLVQECLSWFEIYVVEKDYFWHWYIDIYVCQWNM